MKLENLVKVKNYAEYMRCSHAWILKLMKAGKMNYVKIDGIHFAVLSDDELKSYTEFRNGLNKLLSK